MGKTREIKGRIKAVGNIRRITKTMQMIATSKFARAQQSATAAKPYTEGVFELVRELAATAEDLSHPLIDGPSDLSDADRETLPDLLLVITSDRGLCGPYNGGVLRKAMAHLKATANIETELVGKKGAAFLRFNGVPVATQHAFGDTLHREEIDRLAENYMERFAAGEIGAVHIAYMRFITAGSQKPEIMQLLPLKPPTTEADDASSTQGAMYEFTPDRDGLLEELLPASVKATLNQCMADAVVSEHVARMIAMKAATDNAGRMGKLLKRKFNRARQAQITTELTEIVSGAAALE